jgi:ADP-heptose:LPS heptosyltransferase
MQKGQKADGKGGPDVTTPDARAKFDKPSRLARGRFARSRHEEETLLAAFARRLRMDSQLPISRPRPAVQQKPDVSRVNSIVVWLLAPLGDTLFALPAVRALRRGFPQAHITGVCWTSNRPLLETNPDLDDLLVCTNSTDLPRALAAVQGRAVDLSIGLSNVGSYLCAFHSGAQRVGFHAEGLGWLWDFSFAEDLEGHAIDYCLAVVESLGVDTRGIDRHPQIVLTPDDQAWAETWLGQQGWQPGQILIAIHPGGSHFAAKRWPLTRFTELIARLHTDPNRQVVIVGGQDDGRLAEAILQHLAGVRPPWIAAGKARLRQTAALFGHCQVMVGNDSGPAHLAAAMQTPVVALFGPTSPANFSPYGKDNQVLWKGEMLPCSPCFRFLGGIQQYWPRRLRPGCRMECMQLITVGEVLAAIERVLPARANAGAIHEHS